MKCYKVIINKYSMMYNDYITIVKHISCEDIYHYIGYLYCSTLESIKRIDYQEISIDYYNNNRFNNYYYFNGIKYKY